MNGKSFNPAAKLSEKTQKKELDNWGALKVRGQGVALYAECPATNGWIYNRRGLSTSEWTTSFKTVTNGAAADDSFSVHGAIQISELISFISNKVVEQEKITARETLQLHIASTMSPDGYAFLSGFRPALIFFASILSGYLLIKFFGSRRKNTPPGPFAWPLIGNLHQLGKEPHISLMEMAKKYGSLFRIHFATDICIVLSDYDSIKKAFSNDAYSGRIKGTIIDQFTGNYGLIMSDGDLWKEHRRFALSTLRDLGMGKTWLQERILEEVQYVSEILDEQDGRPYDPNDLINTGVSNIICAAVFGKRFAHNDKDFLALLHFFKESIKRFGQSSLMVLFPMLRFLPGFRSEFNRMKYEDELFFKFMVKMIEDAQKNGFYHEDGSSDYVNAFAKEAKKHESMGKVDSTFDMAQLKVSVGNMFVAGTETTSNTLLIGFLYMVENPDILSKVQNELDAVISHNDVIRLEHKSQLPYTEAVIFELLRLSSIAPLGVFHRTTEPSVLNGFDLPKNTLVISNIYAAHRDPKFFPNPEKFDPTRFLDAEGKFVKSQNVVSFSVGKRACLGENLAQMELFLLFTNLLHKFELVVPAGATVSSQNVHAAVTISPNPYELIFRRRFRN
ncbi:Cytochrome P450 2J6 [Hypsibius exemplaris]|uniref:Cytochrome P450 2J6 n=1 Tax=Hypsibius exemplaris TaxID=2072580 RepID=A0A9X6NIQ2_HYPEX|nr:Cytochrome P450 2J6 [Hypsibius exemplaris]